MFIQVQTSFGLKMQVQVSPEIQIYLNLPSTENTKGLNKPYSYKPISRNMQNFRKTGSIKFVCYYKKSVFFLFIICFCFIGLCGTFNNDTSDDFTTFSGIIESSVQLFAQSWSMGSCTPITGCINTDNGKDLLA